MGGILTLYIQRYIMSIPIRMKTTITIFLSFFTVMISPQNTTAIENPAVPVNSVKGDGGMIG
jgi:hypothetical protein